MRNDILSNPIYSDFFEKKGITEKFKSEEDLFLLRPETASTAPTPPPPLSAFSLLVLVAVGGGWRC